MMIREKQFNTLTRVFTSSSQQQLNIKMNCSCELLWTSLTNVVCCMNCLSEVNLYCFLSSSFTGTIRTFVSVNDQIVTKSEWNVLMFCWSLKLSHTCVCLVSWDVPLIVYKWHVHKANEREDSRVWIVLYWQDNWKWNDTHCEQQRWDWSDQFENRFPPTKKSKQTRNNSVHFLKVQFVHALFQNATTTTTTTTTTTQMNAFCVPLK
jgi:hypothetical protein